MGSFGEKNETTDFTDFTDYFVTGFTGCFFATEDTRNTEGRVRFEFLVFSFELGGNILVMFSSLRAVCPIGGYYSMMLGGWQVDF